MEPADRSKEAATADKSSSVSKRPTPESESPEEDEEEEETVPQESEGGTKVFFLAAGLGDRVLVNLGLLLLFSDRRAVRLDHGRGR